MAEWIEEEVEVVVKVLVSYYADPEMINPQSRKEALATALKITSNGNWSQGGLYTTRAVSSSLKES